MAKKAADKLLDEFGMKASYRREFKFLSTGCYTLDWAVSGKFRGGGLPLGCVVEIFGPPAAGKSLLLNHLYTEAQKLGGFAWVDDTEYAFVPEFAEKVGVDLERVWFPKDDDGNLDPSITVEQHFERVKALLEKIEASGALDVPVVIALDSLGALSTKHEMDAGMEKRDLFKAQLIRKAMRLTQKLVSKTNVLYVVSNHSYDVIDIGPHRGAQRQEASGGKGLKFHSMSRIELVLHGKLYDDKKKNCGVRTKAIVAKNRIIPPFRDTWLSIYYDRGIDKYSYIFDILKQSGVISGGAGGWYTVEGYPDKKWKLNEIEESYEEIIDTVEGIKKESSEGKKASDS